MNTQEMILTSVSNPRIKMLRGLKQKKNRVKEGLFLADGDLLTEEALKSGAPVTEVLVTAEKREVMAPILALAAERQIPVTAVASHVMEALTETDSPQGILAAVRLPEQVLPPVKNGVVCLLEGVSDPGNVGTIIRTADAVGADAVLLCGPCADAYSPKVVRAAMGSLFHLPVVQLPEGEAAVRHYRLAGYTVYGTHLHGTDAFDPDITWARKALLITGSEARGMSEELSRQCDCLLKLPMPGHAESLNAAVATAIFLYTQLRFAK